MSLPRFLQRPHSGGNHHRLQHRRSGRALGRTQHRRRSPLGRENRRNRRRTALVLVQSSQAMFPEGLLQCPRSGGKRHRLRRRRSALGREQQRHRRRSPLGRENRRNRRRTALVFVQSSQAILPEGLLQRPHSGGQRHRLRHRRSALGRERQRHRRRSPLGRENRRNRRRTALVLVQSPRAW